MLVFYLSLDTICLKMQTFQGQFQIQLSLRKVAEAFFVCILSAWGCINLTTGGQPIVNDHVDIVANHDEILFVFKSSADDHWKMEGDVKIQAFYKSASSWNSMFYAWLNTGFLPSNNQVLLKREDLDKVSSYCRFSANESLIHLHS